MVSLILPTSPVRAAASTGGRMIIVKTYEGARPARSPSPTRNKDNGALVMVLRSLEVRPRCKRLVLPGERR
jgi:hypothetical protein